ncbi:hypothetical protein BJY52DRAFT_1229467 [Lactarius psammicola]|nr:hypothetical protein BJY52DRAFT_1229467 [Lactarius psammicola]
MSQPSLPSAITTRSASRENMQVVFRNLGRVALIILGFGKCMYGSPGDSHAITPFSRQVLCVTSVEPGRRANKPEIRGEPFLGAAFRTTFSAPRPPSSGTSATEIKASTSAFASSTPVIRAALLAPASPTSPRAGYRIPDLPHGVEVVTSGTSGPVRLSSSISFGSSILEHPADRKCTDRGKHNITARWLLAFPPSASSTPWPYDSGSVVLNDIVVGSKPGCHKMDSPPMLDRVLLGLGTPDFDLIWTYLIFERF